MQRMAQKGTRPARRRQYGRPQPANQISVSIYFEYSEFNLNQTVTELPALMYQVYKAVGAALS